MCPPMSDGIVDFLGRMLDRLKDIMPDWALALVLVGIVVLATFLVIALNSPHIGRRWGPPPDPYAGYRGPTVNVNIGDTAVGVGGVVPPTPMAPTSKVRVIRETMMTFGRLPLNCDLVERNDFRTLFNIIEDAVLRDNLLRSLYIEFLRDGIIELQVRFTINWRKTIVTVESGPGDPETVMLDKAADKTEGKDFLRIFSPKLFELHGYVERRIAEGKYDEANWTIELRDNDSDKDVVRRAQTLEATYGLTEPAADYLAQRKALEDSNPVRATWKKRGLKEMLLDIVHRR